MALQADSDGFLRGNPYDLQHAIGYLRDIQNGIADMRRAMVAGSSYSGRSAAASNNPPSAAPSIRPVAQPRPRDASGRYLPRNQRAPVLPENPSKAPTPLPDAPAGRAPRSVSGEDEKREGILKRLLGYTAGVASRGGGAAAQGVNGLNEADPTVAAVKEVAGPLKRGYSILFGAKDSKEVSWLKKLYDKSVGFFKAQFKSNRDEQSSLDNIAQGQTNEGSGGGLMATIMSVIGAIGIGAIVDKLFPGLFGAITERVKDSIRVAFPETAKLYDKAVNATSDGMLLVEQAHTATVNKVSDAMLGAENVYKSTVNAVSEGMLNAEKAVSKGWQAAKSFIIGGAAKAGVDPGLLAKITNYESGFNSNARPVRKDGTRISSAHGYGQFLDGTWTEMVNKYGSKYGIANAGKLSKAEAAKYRNDPAIQAGLLGEFTRENVEAGRKYGGANDDANVYALHNLGTGDGQKFLKALRDNPNASVDGILDSKVIAGNKSLYGNGKISVATAYANMGKAMNAGNAYASDARLSAVSASEVPLLPSVPSYANAPFKPQPIPDMPPIPTQLNSQKPQQSVVFLPSNNDVGQDLMDRDLAHAATGGYSKRY